MVLSQQEIALRGHYESMKSLNRGNFLKLNSSHDEIMKDLHVDPGMLFVHLLLSRMSYCTLWVKWFRESFAVKSVNPNCFQFWLVRPRCLKEGITNICSEM